MKKKLIYLGLTGCILFALCTRLQAQIDSLQTHRYVTRATMYGVGFTNVFDTYLSPQEYKGIDFRISRETIRMTKLFDGNVSVQNFFQADIGYTHNRADNNNTFSGLVNWNYGLHYQFRLTENFKLLAGGLIDANGGFVYNLRNTNNPASARAYVNLDASGMAIWHLKIKRYPMVLRCQSTGDGSNVLTALRTILLRDILSGKFDWSDKVHLPAQPAFTAADALGRLTDRIYKNAIQLSG